LFDGHFSMDRQFASAESGEVIARASERLREWGLLGATAPIVVLVSGGGDSTALLLALSEICGPARLRALHVNYGLRGEASDADEAFCRELCRRLGCELKVVKAPPHESGNLQDWARELRYDAAEASADEAGEDAAIAVGHSADDQAETVLYRLFASPGRRALYGIPERRGRIVRPLMQLRRAELREWLEARGEPWREDASNADTRFARVKARELLAAAEELHPAAVANLLTTAEDLRQEGDELQAVVANLLGELTLDDGALDLDRLAELPPALGGAVLRAYVESERGAPAPKAARVLKEALRLGASGERRELQFEGASLAIQRGRARVIDPA
jgi:tRNA(Ile)-lysidine synthase